MHKINTRVTTVTIRRVVQLMPRLTHQSSAQLMITGTMISSCNELALLPLARAAGATDPDTDRAANLHAGLSAVYFDKSRTKRSARIAGASTFQREQLARACGLVRLPMAGLLGQRD